MKNLYIFIFTYLSLLCHIKAQTIWNGDSVIFTKVNFADWTQEENQDRITENVWITRQDRRGIFNIADGDLASGPNCSSNQPNDTEWAFGTIADGIENLNFGSFFSSAFADCSPQSIIDADAVLHLISEDIYIDIRFISWQSGEYYYNNGGGFSYERSTNAVVLSLEEYQARQQKLDIFPNPASEYIQLTGINNTQGYSLFDILGSQVQQGALRPNDLIDIKNFKKGLYFLQLENGSTLKFLKN